MVHHCAFFAECGSQTEAVPFMLDFQQKESRKNQRTAARMRDRHHTALPYGEGRLSKASGRSVFEDLDFEGLVEVRSNLHGVVCGQQGDVRWSGER